MKNLFHSRVLTVHLLLISLSLTGCPVGLRVSDEFFLSEPDSGFHHGESGGAVFPIEGGGFLVGGVQWRATDDGYSVAGPFLAELTAEAAILRWDSGHGASSGCDSIRVIEALEDGGFIAAGGWGAPQGCDFFGEPTLARLDAQGNREWSKAYQNEWESSLGRLVSVRQTMDGGFIACGHIEPQYRPQFYVLKTDSDGNEEWTFTILSESDSRATSVVEKSDGGYRVLGSEEDDILLSPQLLLIDLDIAGAEVSRVSFEAPSPSATSADLLITDDGSYIVSGSVLEVAEQTSDLFLMKMSAEDELLWFNRYDSGRPGFDDMVRVRSTGDGGYVLAGNIRGSFQTREFFVVETDEDGVLKHTFFRNIDALDRLLGRIDGIHVQDLRVLPEGGYVLVGIAFVPVAPEEGVVTDLYMLLLNAGS